MSQDIENLIELSILRDEVQHLKAYAVRLERENAALMDRLSYRRPSTAAIRRSGWLRQRLGMLMHFGALRSAR
jgi:hypothetical protein